MAQLTYEQLVEQNRQLRQEVAEKDRRIAELEARGARLEARVAQLEAWVAQLEARVQRLTQLLEQTQRTTKRQAAPFSKGEPKKDPKPPGRKAGPDYGTPAPPAQLDEVRVKRGHSTFCAHVPKSRMSPFPSGLFSSRGRPRGVNPAARAGCDAPWFSGWSSL